MGIKTSIGWTDATINFWHGCTKVSEGCKYCYMFRDKERHGKDPTEVIKRKKRDILNDLKKIPEGLKIFTCSWSDFFIEEADEWRDEAWEIIKAHPNHIWQILTKRPERIAECLPPDWGNGYPNVWMGVSAENQKRADERIPILSTIPARVRFVSCEPLLEDIDLSHHFMGVCESCNGSMSMPVEGGGVPCGKCLNHQGKKINLHWVITGGESGNNIGKYIFRECKIQWISDILFQCKLNGIAAFNKQLGTHIAKEWSFDDRHGADVSEWPKGLQVQQFPQ